MKSTADLTVIKTLLETDPDGIGFENGADDGSDDRDAKRFNSLVPGSSVNRTDIGRQEMIDAIDPAEYMATTEVQRQYVDLVFSTDLVNAGPTGNIRAGLTNIFGGGSLTVSNFSVAFNREGTYLEVLKEASTISESSAINESEIADARRLP